MIQEREIKIEERSYGVTISDESATLLAAQAAGRVAVGFLSGKEDAYLPVHYVIECLDVADDVYLEKVVRRHAGIPWQIGESERILVREFTIADQESLGEANGKGDVGAGDVFATGEALTSYIRNQYGFYEYGIWAIIRKTDGVLLGKAGVSACNTHRIPEMKKQEVEMQMELGYHIFSPYRKSGCATEACRIILDYVKENFDCPVYAVTSTQNEASIRVLNRLGFHLIVQTHSEEMQADSLYGWNC